LTKGKPRFHLHGQQQLGKQGRLEGKKRDQGGDFKMAKKSRGGRITAAKKRAAKKPGGRGAIKKRAAGRNIMKT
jgi:hypothetical protein